MLLKLGLLMRMLHFKYCIDALRRCLVVNIEGTLTFLLCIKTVDCVKSFQCVSSFVHP